MLSKPTAKKTPAKKTAARRGSPDSQRFAPAKLDSLFVALDAIAWLDAPTGGQVAQFAGIDRGTAGKLLKNAIQIGLVEVVGSGYGLVMPYPYKGSPEQKQAVVKEALVRLPLLTSVRQFILFGDKTEVAVRRLPLFLGSRRSFQQT